MADDHQLIAYQLQPDAYKLTTGTPGRDWMSTAARRCLPMLIANQAGWLILNKTPVRATWTGEPGLNAITIEGAGTLDHAGAISHFGSGILTFTIPYLFRTPPGYNLLVRGPANHPKDAITPLEGLIETDWTVASFTMNWKITRPDTWITFDADEPICMIVPQHRHELEQFTPQIQPIHANPQLRTAVADWQTSRETFNSELNVAGSDAAKKGWEKDYFQGKTAPQHQTRLHLKPFSTELS